MQKSIDKLLRSAIEAGDAPGIVATVARADEVIYADAFGQRQLGGDAPMQLDSVLYIASMTKAVTTAAAMQLVEQGKIELDAPAANYAPAISETQVLTGFDSDGQPQLRAPKTPVTLRHLLTHTSGFGYEIFNKDIGRYQQATGAPGILAVRKESLRMPLVFDPGEGWEYGVGIAWAGQVVEAVSGQRLGDYLQAALFEPLGMSDTSFIVRPDLRERAASMHARTAEGALAVFPLELPLQPEIDLGGEALYSTGSDYLRFLRMLLGGGKLDGRRVLKTETVAMMGQNQIGALDYAPMRTAMPELSLDTDFYPGMQQKWGLSFLINTQVSPEGRSAGSLSWAGLSNCYYWIDPKKNVSGALYTQILPFFDPKIVALFRAFESTVYKELK